MANLNAVTSVGAAPNLYRDEWVERRGGNPWPNSIGLTVSDRTWPDRMVPRADRLVQAGSGEGCGVFFVLWFNRVTGEPIASTWEFADGLRLLDLRPFQMPDARAAKKALGVAAAEAMKALDEQLASA
jgi:hypothetical protein